jgi:hypothetical protein
MALLGGVPNSSRLPEKKTGLIREQKIVLGADGPVYSQKIPIGPRNFVVFVFQSTKIVVERSYIRIIK